jgi:hypothetical protein
VQQELDLGLLAYTNMEHRLLAARNTDSKTLTSVVENKRVFSRLSSAFTRTRNYPDIYARKKVLGAPQPF